MHTICMVKKLQRMEVMGDFRPEDVLPYITRLRERRDYKGDDGRTWSVKMWSNRYFTFRKSLSCVVCDLTGTFMSLERQAGSDGRPHFNLYAMSDDGRVDRRVLMTKDHIEPKSKGGKDAAGNFQTMCSVCNSLKAHHKLNLTQMKLLRTAYDTLGADGVDPKEVQRVVDGMASRMASDDGGAPMKAGDLAEMLLMTPDAVVAIKDAVGHDRVRGVAATEKGITDSDNLPPRFIVIR